MQATRCNDQNISLDCYDSMRMLKQAVHVTRTTITLDGSGHKQIGFAMDALAAETLSTPENNIAIVFLTCNDQVLNWYIMLSSLGSGLV